jgi:hypothetical protein
MTQSEIERAVCRATGETRRTIRSYGFNLQSEESESFEDLSLVLDCPGCGAPLDAANASTGPLKFIECSRCDAVYPFTVDEIYVGEAGRAPLPVCA